jgi:DNA-binding beta-propeller fold protein YncE
VWVPSAAGDLVRIDPATERIVARIPVHGSKLAWGYLSLWETTRDHRVVRVDVASNEVVASIRVAPGENDWDDEIAIGYGSVWVAVGDRGMLVRIDPSSDQVVARIRGFGVSNSGMPIAIGEGAVWALRLVGDREMLFRVDPLTNHLIARIPVGPRPASAPGTVTVGAGSVWTGNWDSTISRIDPVTNSVIATYKLEDPPQNVTFGYGAIWVDAYEASKVWRIRPDPA